MGIGFEVLKNLMRKPFTKKYPKERVKPPPRYRGKLAIDKKKCIACGLCRMICPSGAVKLGIKIEKVKAKGIEYKKITHPIHSIDMGKCVFCGLCVNICPKDVISFTREFELARKSRKKLLVR
jgi:NADH-quinone oxidoreductase subunit I